MPRHTPYTLNLVWASEWRMALRKTAFLGEHEVSPVGDRMDLFRETIVDLTANGEPLFDGHDGTRAGTVEIRELDALHPGARGFTVIVRLYDVETRRIASPDTPTIVSFGTMVDDSGQMRFVALDSAELRDGNVLKIVNGEVTELAGERVFVITRRSYLIPIKYEEMAPIKRLAELRNGEKGINLLVAVLVAELKRVGSRFVLSGTLSDESGKLPFTSWGPHLEEGTIVRIENAYVKSWNGMPTVNVGEASVIYEIEHEVPPRLAAPQDVSISELAIREGMYDVMVTGSVISIRPGSGVIQRCPKCGRTVHAARCPKHGDISPVRDFRIKALIDDGTGAVTAVIGRRPAERTYEQLVTQGIATRQATSLGTLEDNPRLLLGMALNVRGDATTSEYGTTLVVKDVTVERDGKAHIEQIKRRLENLQW